MARKIKKNPKGGKKHKQKASKDFRDNFNGKITYKDSKLGQQYALVVQRLGGNRLLVKAIINKELKEVQAVIPGSFRKKHWMSEGDLILIQARNFNSNQYDIIYKYNSSEEKELKKTGALIELYSSEEKDEKEEENTVFFTERIDEDYDDEDDIFETKDNDSDTELINRTTSNNNNKFEIDFDDI